MGGTLPLQGRNFISSIVRRPVVLKLRVAAAWFIFFFLQFISNTILGR